MKHIIFDILPSTILVASEASIAGFTVVWLGLSPFLAPLVWAWAAMMFGMVTAIVVGGIFFRQAFRVAIAEEELSASFDE